MNYINFESGRDKEKARQELREARNALLEKARINAERRLEVQEKSRERGEGTWMLPQLSEKIEKESSKTKKKSKKHKKDKKKKHKKYRKSSDSNDSNSEDEWVEKDKLPKKKKSKKSKKKQQQSSDSNDSTESEEKDISLNFTNKSENSSSLTKERDDWMTMPGLLQTYSRNDLKKEKNEVKDVKQSDAYKPGESTRELNPYWKDGGDGLPSLDRKSAFKKPDEDRDEVRHTATNSSRRGGWRRSDLRKRSRTPDKRNYENSPRLQSPDKCQPRYEKASSSKIYDNKQTKNSETITYFSDNKGNDKRNISDSDSSSNGDEPAEHQSKSQQFLTDEEMNQLAAKLVKAEILGNQSLITELKNKLESAREYRKSAAQNISQKSEDNRENAVVLTHTDSRGISRPLKAPTTQDDYYGKNRKNKKKKVDTHSGGDRVRYFADDDKHSLKDMFERERLNTTDDQNKQFAEIVAKHTNPNDNLEDIFAEKIQKSHSDSKEDERNRSRAIHEHQKLSRALESCEYCIDSNHMQKHLLVAMGERVYISIPSKEGLQRGHCLIVPMQHVTCSTLLDENVWSEIQSLRKALTRMFRSRKMDVVFFETAMFLHRSPHMVIECIPGPEENMELIPMYFKKAILECEGEWSHNKKLVDLKGRDVRKAIPKGLAYFWVDFGDDSGFAHVIEEQERFPRSFAQEIIGGLLGLEPRLWRHPKKQHLPIQKVTEFAEMWKPFDITST